MFDSHTAMPVEFAVEGDAEFCLVCDELRSRDVVASITLGISNGRAVIDVDSTMDLGKVRVPLPLLSDENVYRCSCRVSAYTSTHT